MVTLCQNREIVLIIDCVDNQMATKVLGTSNIPYAAIYARLGSAWGFKLLPVAEVSSVALLTFSGSQQNMLAGRRNNNIPVFQESHIIISILETGT